MAESPHYGVMTGQMIPHSQRNPLPSPDADPADVASGRVRPVSWKPPADSGVRESLLQAGVSWVRDAREARDFARLVSGVASCMSTLDAGLLDLIPDTAARSPRQHAAESCRISARDYSLGPCSAYQIDKFLAVSGVQHSYRKLLEKARATPGGDLQTESPFGTIRFGFSQLETAPHLVIEIVNTSEAKLHALRTELRVNDEVGKIGRQLADQLRRTLAVASPSGLSPGVHASVMVPNDALSLSSLGLLAHQIADRRGRLSYAYKSLDEIATTLSPQRVSKFGAHGGYLANTPFGYGLLLEKSSSEALRVGIHLDPPVLTASSQKHFLDSHAAVELAATLQQLGLFELLPKLRGYFLENDTNFQLAFGNGYASLSRRLCSMATRSQDPDRIDIIRSIGDARREFSDALASLRAETRLSSTRQILDLLVGICGDPAENGNYKKFNSFDSRREGSCIEAESSFVFADPARDLRIADGFLCKSDGSPTALSTEPLIIAGTTFPRGTLFELEFSNGAVIAADPLRLTMFALPLTEAKDTYAAHYERMSPTELVDDRIEMIYELLDGARAHPLTGRPSVSRIGSGIQALRDAVWRWTHG